MWNETIAAAAGRGGAAWRALAGKLLTGPAAFLIVGSVDLLFAVRLLRTRTRAKRSF